MSGAHHDVRKEVISYIAVFVALGLLTILTVGAAYLPLVTLAAIVIGLMIAIVKGSLVGLIFMHLKAERKMIYWALLLTLVLFAALILLPILAFKDQVAL